jgi:serine/threonine-protein kinase
VEGQDTPIATTEAYHGAMPGERVRVAVAGPGGPPTDNLHGLLLGRLRIFALMVAVPFALLFSFLVWEAVNVIQEGRLEEMGGAAYAVSILLSLALPLLVSAVSALILWRYPPTSVSELRIIECVITGAVAVSMLWGMGIPEIYGNLERASTEVPRNYKVILLAYTHVFSLRWFCMLVVYGALIPNTWQRCAAVVTVLGLSPLALFALWGLWVRPLEPGLVLRVLVILGLWIAVAASVVVFTAYRIELLHHQATVARKLGQYVLKERLGAGGMGEVYLAEHALLRRPCALKLIRPSDAGSDMQVARFEREVQATAALTHPNTVEIYDYGRTEDGTFYYVMEYLPGLTLAELVRQHGPLPPARAIHLLRQVCGALREAHGVGLIHRDIKPANIIVCSRGGVCDVIKLLDFGLVRGPVAEAGQGKLTGEGTLAGTPEYMSPEQAEGRPGLDARCDIYSLGGVAYYLLTGKPPFQKPTIMQVLLAHVNEPATPPAGAPPDLQAVVMKCLEKGPERRFRDIAELDRALRDCKTEGPWSEEQAIEWWRKQ